MKKSIEDILEKVLLEKLLGDDEEDEINVHITIVYNHMKGIVENEDAALKSRDEDDCKGCPKVEKCKAGVVSVAAAKGVVAALETLVNAGNK